MLLLLALTVISASPVLHQAAHDAEAFWRRYRLPAIVVVERSDPDLNWRSWVDDDFPETIFENSLNRPRWSLPGVTGDLIHEIGHLLGLEHSDDPASVMYPYAGPHQVLTPADLLRLHSHEKTSYERGTGAPVRSARCRR